MTIERPMFPPVDPTRRRFLCHAASVAAGGAVLAVAASQSTPAAAAQARLAASPDPVFTLIEAHRDAAAAYNAVVDSVKHLGPHVETDHLLAEPCDVEMDALDDVLNAVPESMPGLRAWVGYIHEITVIDPYRLSEENFAVFMPNLAEAFAAVVTS